MEAPPGGEERGRSLPVKCALLWSAGRMFTG